jgi:hypothetical protein
MIKDKSKEKVDWHIGEAFYNSIFNWDMEYKAEFSSKNIKLNKLELKINKIKKTYELLATKTWRSN